MMRLNHLTVGDLMTTAVITVFPASIVDEAQTEMRTADIRHLPVVDRHRRLVGILSDRDLLKQSGTLHSTRRRVEEVMTRDVLTVAPETLAREAAALLIDNKIGALPVLDENLALVGVITETDFLRVALSALGGEALSSSSD